jgi:hypothetical protein
MIPGVCVTCPALLDEELEIQAAGAARKGRSAVMGLAVRKYQYRVQLQADVVARGIPSIPRSAIAAVDRVVESIFERACIYEARGWRADIKEGRVERWRQAFWS